MLLALAVPGALCVGLLTLDVIVEREGAAEGRLVSFALPQAERIESPRPEDAPTPPQGDGDPAQEARPPAPATFGRTAPVPLLEQVETQIAPQVVPLAITGAAPRAMPAVSSLAVAQGSSDSGYAEEAQGSSASAEGGASATGAEGDDAYGQAIHRRIRREQRYEQVLRRQRLAGTVVVAFTIDPHGRLRDRRIVRSSGHSVLDRIALRHLAAGAPFPRPPRGEPRSFQIPMTYRQRE
ncbi:energy transducer TonB family protein [Alteriqipengyuania sp. 357]